nr:ulp1 protease family, C-terminal catalytic domain-containing protein [Tanacetum cinerariifolium]
FEKQWEEERNDPDKATELHLIPDLRSSKYCLARAPRDKVGIKPLPAELIDVSKKLNESFSPRQDHRRLNLSSTKSIVREEQQGEHNESSSTKPIDVSTSVFKIQCIKEETYGCLYVPSFALAGQQVICATATIYPILRDDGYNKWMSRADIAETYSICVNKKVFCQTDEFYFTLNATDIIELLTYTELELGILTLFEMSLYQLKDHSSTNKVGFLNPMMITADLCFHEKFATVDYLAQSLTCYEYYLAPFLQGRHYVLLIICPKDGRGFILNLQKDSQTNENCYRLAGLVDSVVGSLKWNFPLVNRQPKD